MFDLLCFSWTLFQLQFRSTGIARQILAIDAERKHLIHWLHANNSKHCAKWISFITSSQGFEVTAVLISWKRLEPLGHCSWVFDQWSIRLMHNVNAFKSPTASCIASFVTDRRDRAQAGCQVKGSLSLLCLKNRFDVHCTRISLIFTQNKLKKDVWLSTAQSYFRVCV